MASPHVNGALMAVVADGMGGKTGGALAASQAVATARSFFKEWRLEDPIQKGLEHMVDETHTVIRLAAITEEKEVFRCTALATAARRTPADFSWHFLLLISALDDQDRICLDPSRTEAIYFFKYIISLTLIPHQHDHHHRGDSNGNKNI